VPDQRLTTPSRVAEEAQEEAGLRPRRLVDRALQNLGLIVGTAGPHAILRGVAPKRRGHRCCPRGIRRHRQRPGKTGGGCSDEMAAIDVHDRVSGRRSSRASARFGVTQKYGGAW